MLGNQLLFQNKQYLQLHISEGIMMSNQKMPNKCQKVPIK